MIIYLHVYEVCIRKCLMFVNIYYAEIRMQTIIWHKIPLFLYDLDTI